MLLHQLEHLLPWLPGAFTSSVDALFRCCSAGVCWHIPWDQYLFLCSRLHRERENDSTNKTFCSLIFHSVPFSRKKVLQCPKNWSKTFALHCMVARERKRSQPEKRDRATVELVVVVEHPSMTVKARWVTKAEVDFTAYSMCWLWQIIINTRFCLKANT